MDNHGLTFIIINNFYRPLLSILAFSHTKTTVAVDSVMVKLDLKNDPESCYLPNFCGKSASPQWPTMAVDNVLSIHVKLSTGMLALYFLRMH